MFKNFILMSAFLLLFISVNVSAEDITLTTLMPGGFCVKSSDPGYENDIYYNTGKVGIGKTAPQQNLHIYEDLTANPTWTTAITLQNNARSWALGVKGSAENGAFIIYDPTTEQRRVTIDMNGNVGIGTTGPLGKLIVKGAGTTTGVGLQTQNSSGTALVTTLDNGNVGIGTTGPGAQLALEGN